jgi:hypothetical protein
MASHYAWVELADPVGMLEMHHAVCYACGWKSEPTHIEEEAKEAKLKHERDTYEMTSDDLQWLTGTGRYAQ